MQSCGSECSWCARNWFKWLKTRESQMSVALKDTARRKGCSISFSEAARTSVRPPDPAVGTKVRVKSFQYPHEAVVVHNSGSTGMDGRWWVGVMVDGWYVHVERKDLTSLFGKY